MITDIRFINIRYIARINKKVFIKTPEDDILKIKKLIPLILSVAILIGVTAVSSGKKVSSPSVSKTVSTTDETECASKDEIKETDFDEMRGIWISYIELSMENENDKSEQAFRNKFEKIAENCKGYGLNTLIVQVRPYGDAPISRISQLLRLCHSAQRGQPQATYTLRIQTCRTLAPCWLQIRTVVRCRMALPLTGRAY